MYCTLFRSPKMQFNVITRNSLFLNLTFKQGIILMDCSNTYNYTRILYTWVTLCHLHLEYVDRVPCRGVKQPPNRGFWVWHQTAFGGEVSVLEIWGVRSTASLSLLPGQLWLGVIVTVSVTCMDQIDLFKNYLFLTERIQKRKHL